MQFDDQVANWLIRWEEARAANLPPPDLEELPPELRPSAREALRLLQGFVRMSRGQTAPPGCAPPAPPDTPRYRFEAFLARGGMSDVWRGYDIMLARDVALKVLREPVFGARARFEEEARHVSQLEHPSIVPVYDLGELPDGRPFFVMKLIHGQTLAELLAARTTPAVDLPIWVEVFEQIGATVAFAHKSDLIHRDLKPSNVMLGEFGEVLVMDWGIAKVLAATPRPAPRPSTPVVSALSASEASTSPLGPETLPGESRGTPAFMAPEQARGEVSRVGKASDVFGLGGILCVILTGQPPYTRAEQVFSGDVTEAFARLDSSGADADLIGLAKACLAPVPESRPADAEEVAGRAKHYRHAVAARQARTERELWLCQLAGTAALAVWEGRETFPPAVEATRARFRQQAWELLRVEMASQAQLLSSANPADAAAARQVLEALRGLPGLAGVRNPAALAHLPQLERQRWEAFWEEVAELLRVSSPTCEPLNPAGPSDIAPIC